MTLLQYFQYFQHLLHVLSWCMGQTRTVMQDKFILWQVIYCFVQTLWQIIFNTLFRTLNTLLQVICMKSQCLKLHLDVHQQNCWSSEWRPWWNLKQKCHVQGHHVRYSAHGNWNWNCPRRRQCSWWCLLPVSCLPMSFPLYQAMCHTVLSLS